MPLNKEQSCSGCRWFKKFHNEHEFGHCGYPMPFWIYVEMMEIRRPDLNENEGKECATYQEKPNGK